MGWIIFLAVIFVSFNVWSHTEGVLPWVYFGTLVVSYFAALFLAGTLQQTKTLKGTKTPDVMTIAFPVCYLVICGGATAAVWFDLPWDQIAMAAGIVPVWLFVYWAISCIEDSGYGTSATHELANRYSGARVGPARAKDVYEHKHGAGSWKSSEDATQLVLKLIAFAVITGFLWYYGLYILIGVLTVTAIIRGIIGSD